MFDGLSLGFILLTNLLIPLCLLVVTTSIKTQVLDYIVLFLLLEIQLITAFSVIDIVLFYIFFESILIPMFIIVGIWGGRSLKISAAYKLMIYTVGGSVLMLLAILYLYYNLNSSDLYIILYSTLTETSVKFIWFCFFLAFAVKVPLIPFHLWLPEAHVEAPTGGSVILAGLLLKLGTFGVLRYLIGFIPKGIKFYLPIIITIVLLGVIYTGFTTLRQIDIKKS